MQKIPKRWRELPKEERFKIPTRFFNIDEKTINRIRAISDIKKRLVESARVQYELFNDIHSYLTVWIAGYGSDVVIRQKFGSTQNLLNLFFKPIKFADNIKPSWSDIKRRIRIPEEMTKELAEETGIHIGDGNLNVHRSSSGNSYSYSITGDLLNEAFYHHQHIYGLIKILYGIEPRFAERTNKNSIETIIKSKAIVEFKNKFLKLVIGPKKNIQIPPVIMHDEEFQRRCISGIIDTDFSITSSLAITGKLHSLFVAKEMHKIFEEQNIKHIFQQYQEYGRFYIGKEMAEKIILYWGLHNQKHLSKYNMFKEFGKFIPFSTTPERLAVLSGKLTIEDLERICKKRASVKALDKSPYVFRLF
jgi:hypothetical protein